MRWIGIPSRSAVFQERNSLGNSSMELSVVRQTVTKVRLSSVLRWTWLVVEFQGWKISFCVIALAEGLEIREAML